MKLIATMHFAALARKKTDMRIFAVSPGSTCSDGAVGREGKLVMCVAGTLRLAHTVVHGADRYVQLVNRPQEFKSGTFYASAVGLTGQMGEQAKFQAVLEDTEKQDMIMESLRALCQ
uniref:Uncharacterized protein n=1 Tax=Chromera velia CCMP2878 TaxID=1169474 RepID=A0A0K6S9W5_9ALVE|eukprot:Cvel_8636.t1-p1 / transcript=Cvel_8636.t1 / gene=Cvel_8636 / organism=Chromera_velia_CCMP2878 / gene_product=hypothetical protein / transcript_product=hypothetical protein / location=Cvel_scaffold481:16332-16679(+) / protein_length=116 / sequence_SO=supercontig / SO=protein_coding / is_pseudo=false